ncbi:MAG: DUF4738 domain-containing protein [Prevotella sp.]|nr:DUF4738 domain-containing protein [Prevotella sp.]
MKRLCCLTYLLTMLLLVSCKQHDGRSDGTGAMVQENAEAKGMLQGVWMVSDTEEVYLKASGDTIFFADGTSQPAYFRIVGDSIQLGPNTYLITKQTKHNFWFRNHAGDELRLVRQEEGEGQQAPAVMIEESSPVIATSDVVNLDSVVMYSGQRFHWYITVNPSRNKVVRTSYNPEGVAVENVYYDNIIHVSLFKMNQRLYTRDYNKRAFADNVPEDFLQQSILGNIRYSHVDSNGFHFYATVCIPDGEQCYMIEILIGFNGQQSLKLMES